MRDSNREVEAEVGLYVVYGVSYLLLSLRKATSNFPVRHTVTIEFVETQELGQNQLPASLILRP
jgi:transposase-like protein